MPVIMEVPPDEASALERIRALKAHGYGELVITVDAGKVRFLDEKKRHKV